MIRFKGSAVLVTGGAGGIGRATVERFAGEGARVAIADYDLEKAEKLAASLNAGGADTRALFFDAAEVESGTEIVRRTIETFGTIDVLVNNVGGNDLSKDLDILNLDIDYFDRLFHINLRSMIVTAKAALPEMIFKNSGAIVNVASISGLLGDFRGSLYGMSKAGVINLTRYIATQYGKQGIRCNAVAPGLVMTPAATKALPDNLREIFLRHNAVHYLGKAEDIAGTIAYLASEDARYVSCQTITADGGMSCHNPTIGDLIELFEMEKENKR